MANVVRNIHTHTHTHAHAHTHTHTHTHTHKTRVTAEVLDLCDKRRKLRKKRFEPDGSEKYKEVNDIKRYMKKANGKNWIGQ